MFNYTKIYAYARRQKKVFLLAVVGALLATEFGLVIVAVQQWNKFQTNFVYPNSRYVFNRLNSPDYAVYTYDVLLSINNLQFICLKASLDKSAKTDIKTLYCPAIERPF